ncbi:MAG: tyrosine-type recombinase/integrase [Pseudomonadota bacterium]|jgi:integrase/recombinase XerD|nr:tyrosine-type recombinase/integrase [Pseudomonadota bacterium]MDQ5942969.1 tyrosine-type recombinase/integrase [Pseudomonadota bacterium]MDQ5958935.1 tyrosine-type recombinase/integrase [Pseudomonadota bacterium]
MLTTYFKSSSAVARYRAGSAGPYLEQFISWLVDRGYQRASIRHHIEEVGRFAAWCDAFGLGSAPPNQAILAKLRAHLTEQGRERYPCGLYRHIYQSARVYIRFLEEIGVVCPVAPNDGADTFPLFAEFCDWMRAHRGTRDITLVNYRVPVMTLLRTLESPGTYSAAGLRAYFLQQVNPLHPEKSKNLATALRMFLRFLVARGECTPGLEFAVPTVARWRLSTLPKYIQPEEVEALIASCDSSTPLGARDRAILLLIARLGLRAGDVNGLQFRHLLWSEGMLKVAGKNRHEVELPLPQEVGDAILHYLKTGRPALKSDFVFITITAPFVPITRQVVGRTVARAIGRTGIDAPNRGAHLLRHSVATAMLRDGMSLPAIGALLRHRSVETTMVYAKVDVNLLKEVVQPWPGVRPC